MEDLKVVIEIGDWLEEWNEKGKVQVNTMDDVFRLLEEKFNTDEISRFAAVTRALELSKVELLPEDKELYESGITGRLRVLIRRLKKSFITGSGKELEVPAWIGKPGRKPILPEVLELDEEEQGELPGPSYVWFEGSEAIERADAQLGTALGHIYNALLTLLANGEDIYTKAEYLKDRIDEIVDQLTN